MRELKAAVIGAGSTYTPELLEGFIERREYLNFTSIYLMDIDENKLGVIYGLAARMFKKAGVQCKLVQTLSLDEAVTGADYVFAQIRVGGLAARIRDEKIPKKYGLLGQETTGIGGFMNALRTVPVMLDIARKIEELAPNAWLINFSNPSGIVAEAILNNSGVKMFGLCNCPINMLADIAGAIGTKDFTYDYVGLNHLSWITSVVAGGREYADDLKAGRASDAPGEGGGSFDASGFISPGETGAGIWDAISDEWGKALINAVPAIPSYYLNYYYMRDQQLKKCLEADRTRGEQCVDIEAELLEQYKDPELNVKPAGLSKRGGALYSTAAISAAEAIENDKNEFHVVNVKNCGALPYLNDDDVVEVKCLLNKEGAKPVKAARAGDDFIIGLTQAVKAYEKLTVKAALSGSREDALAALLVHPLIGDFAKAKGALDEMIAANIDYLPAFR